ncbi:MAG: RsbRD N-terminal domain-containing protein [Desulfobulbales bacterium]
MDLKSFLTEKKKAIVQRWIDQVLDSYGSPTFFKKQKDRFANPVGSTISDSLSKLYTVLSENQDLAEAAKPLEDMIKIRAVQDFAPSQAVSFVYLLKNIVRQELVKEKKLDKVLTDLATLEVRIDKVALMAFDFYMNCRERLHRIRVNEVLSGRSALTDGTQCVSAMLKKEQTELADNNQNNRLT